MKNLNEQEIEQLITLLSKLEDQVETFTEEEISNTFDDEFYDKEDLVGSIDTVKSIVFNL